MAGCGNEGQIKPVLPNVDSEPSFAKKVVQTVFIIGIYSVLGVIRGQEGLTFLDLIRLTDSDITKGSMMFTFSSLGYVGGALFIGILYDKLNNDILHGSCVILVGIFTVLIPWCDTLPLMITICGLRALFQGPADSGSSVICAKVWLLKAAPVLQGLQFLFAVGGIISPFVTEPFLNQLNDSRLVPAEMIHLNFYNSTVPTGKIVSFSSVSEYDFISSIERNTWMNSSSRKNLHQTNISTSNSNHSDLNSTMSISTETSRVYIAFTISGTLSISLAVAFLLKTTIYGIGDFDRFQEVTNEAGQKLDRADPLFTFPTLVKIMCCTLLAVHCFAHGCVEKIYMMFLMTFVVEYLGWNKLNGSIANATFWVGFAAGRLLAVIITNCLRPRTVIVLSLLGLILLQGCMIAVEYLKLSEALWWVLVGGSGLFIGPLFASNVSWVGLNLTPVRGKIMSFMYVWMFVGSMTHLYLLGYLFEHYSPMWFVYLLLVYTILALVTFLSLQFVVTNQPKVLIVQEEETVPLQNRNYMKQERSKHVEVISHDGCDQLPNPKQGIPACSLKGDTTFVHPR